MVTLRSLKTLVANRSHRRLCSTMRASVKLFRWRSLTSSANSRIRLPLDFSLSPNLFLSSALRNDPPNVHLINEMHPKILIRSGDEVRSHHQSLNVLVNCRRVAITARSNVFVSMPPVQTVGCHYRVVQYIYSTLRLGISPLRLTEFSGKIDALTGVKSMGTIRGFGWGRGGLDFTMQ